MDYGVVIVTINYRLGPFGFLSTGDDEIPANLGLWDQVGFILVIVNIMLTTTDIVPETGPRVGAGQYRGVRWRPQQCDDIRAECWQYECLLPYSITSGWTIFTEEGAEIFIF